ncbi:MAG: phosphate acyltransferase PlsX [Planctomycetes bacterium]|nr:phosphate acyltransferase PlsX [Planctomycetota bacterium]
MAALRIALDVMGGDHAPDATLKGALLSVSAEAKHRIEPSRLLLVGDKAAIEQGLAALGGNPGFEIVHASQVIAMAESPASALRSKPDSSIAVSIALVKKGLAGAAVSMGNTGAMVGAATLMLGTLEGVKRPGIAVAVNLTGKPVTLLDMGANTAPKAQHLVQYGLMGSVYARACLGLAEPRVGLLNIGEEEGKGTELHKEAYPLFKASGLNFVGNIEGHDIFRQSADVVVTDGFTGNVVLKLLEGFSQFMLQLVLGELKAHGASWAGEALAHVKKRVDYAEYGGALLLGVQGTVVIGHGRSDATAVSNAIGQGARAMDAQVNEHIVTGLSRAGAQA